MSRIDDRSIDDHARYLNDRFRLFFDRLPRENGHTMVGFDPPLSFDEKLSLARLEAVARDAWELSASPKEYSVSDAQAVFNDFARLTLLFSRDVPLRPDEAEVFVRTMIGRPKVSFRDALRRHFQDLEARREIEKADRAKFLEEARQAREYLMKRSIDAERLRREDPSERRMLDMFERLVTPPAILQSDAEQVRADELREVIRESISSFLKQGEYPTPAGTTIESIEKVAQRLAHGLVMRPVEGDARRLAEIFGGWMVEAACGAAPNGIRQALEV